MPNHNFRSPYLYQPTIMVTKPCRWTRTLICVEEDWSCTRSQIPTTLMKYAWSFFINIHALFIEINENVKEKWVVHLSRSNPRVHWVYSGLRPVLRPTFMENRSVAFCVIQPTNRHGRKHYLLCGGKNTHDGLIKYNGSLKLFCLLTYYKKKKKTSWLRAFFHYYQTTCNCRDANEPNMLFDTSKSSRMWPPAQPQFHLQWCTLQRGCITFSLCDQPAWQTVNRFTAFLPSPFCLCAEIYPALCPANVVCDSLIFLSCTRSAQPSWADQTTEIKSQRPNIYLHFTSLEMYNGLKQDILPSLQGLWYFI